MGISWDEYYKEEAPVKKEEEKVTEPRVAEVSEATKQAIEAPVQTESMQNISTEDVSSEVMQNIENYTTKKVLIYSGGKERCDSSLIALKKIRKYRPKNVLIHDAARPHFSLKLLDRLKQNLKKNDAVVPILKTTNSIKYKEYRN